MRRSAGLLTLLLVAACRLPGAPAGDVPVQLEHTVVASSSTSRTVTLEATRGACDEEQPPSVVETAEQVRVVLTVLRSGEACTDQGVLWRPQIVLREPLGDRPVVPGP